MSSREQFEAWYLENWGCTEDNHETLFEISPCGNEYYRFGVRLASQAWQAAIKQSEAKCAELAAENAGMGAFVNVMLAIAWDGCSADGAEIQELALKQGLIREEVYSQDDHENLVDDPGNFEDGDSVYFRVETPATDAFLAEVRASAVDEACLKISNAIVNCYQDEQIGLDAAATICGDFAAQLRQEAQ